MDTKKTTIGIIGVGKWGKNLLKEYSAQADVTWCAYRGDELTKKFLEESYPHIKTTTSYEDILNDPSVDAVVVATPTHTHFEIAKKVLESNKHLFLEKPGCGSSRELEQLCIEAQKRGLIFVVGYEFVHHPALNTIKERILNSKIHFIHTEWFKWGTFTDDAIPHLLSHELSIFKYIGITDIHITHIKKERFISDSDMVYAEFETSHGPISSLINRVSPEKRKTITIHTDTEILVWNNNDLFTSSTQEKTLEPIHVDTTSPVSLEIKDFLSAITEHTQPTSNGYFALDIFKIIENISTYSAK